MPRIQSGPTTMRRSRSAPPAPRHTSNVGALLYHEPAPARRNHARDNVRAMREKARQLKESRDEAAKTKQPFKLRQFENVPARVNREKPRSHSVPSRPSSAPAHRTDKHFVPSRPSSAPAHRTDNDHSFLSNASSSKQPRSASLCSAESPGSSPGWRVSSGYKSLSNSPPSLATGAPATPPRCIVKSPQVRMSSTPVKSSRCKRASRESPTSKMPLPCDGGVSYGFDEGLGLDVAKFDQVAKDLKEMQLRRTPTKDGSSMHELLRQSNEDRYAIPDGYRLAPEEERLETLETLRGKLADLSDSYHRLPLRIETEGQRKQQQLLRDNIAETERAVQVFSRAKVFVEI